MSIDTRLMMIRADLIKLANDATRIGDQRTAARIRTAIDSLRPTYTRPGDFVRSDDV